MLGAAAALFFGLVASMVLLALAEITARVAVPRTVRVNDAAAPDEAFNWRVPARYVVYRSAPNADVWLDATIPWV